MKLLLVLSVCIAFAVARSSQLRKRELTTPAPNAYETSLDPAGKAMQFALDLFRAADPKNPEENYIISPLSPQVLLAQLTEGCSEEAKMEMVKAVRLNSNEAASLTNALIKAANNDSTVNQLDIASMFFKSVDVTLMQKFQEDTEMNKIPIQEIDFSDTFEAARTVNDWANRKTRGNIPQVITEENIAPDTAMMLVNAVYFKGTWQYKFNQSETDVQQIFERTPYKNMSVHMMAQTNRFRYGEINYAMHSNPQEGLRWVELPYDGNQLSMILFLPKVRHQLDEMMKKMNSTHLQKIFEIIRGNRQLMKIHLKVPRFTIKSSTSLVEPLKELGIKKIFEEDNSLSELFETPAKVGDVQQDAFLSVDEEGTTATAVTRVSIVGLSTRKDNISFVCNEPFMIMLVDKIREIPLFMAKIRQPEERKSEEL